MDIRTRFAPSPTGYLHIGSLRTALFAYLIAKSLGGKIILRIEDTDQKRYVPDAVEKLISILDWVGIKFDEGPHVGGEYGPYTQSERKDIYEKYGKELVSKGEAYYCFCDSERLEKMRAEQQAKKEPPRYDRCCRDLAPEEINKKINSGARYVIRQKMPLKGEVLVHDELRGDIKFKAVDLEDHVLVKSDGMPTYHFALIIDDHLMAISHVLRGEEWIPSFPKNILLYRSFGWEPPKFYHMPLTLNKGGGKLSKRQGDVAVEDYKEKGYLPEALINFCVLLGWHPKDNNELFTLAQLENQFKIEGMGTSPAVFDIEKLDFFNGYYIRHKNIDDLADLAIPYITKEGLIEETGKNHLVIKANKKNLNLDDLKKIIALEQERLKKLSDLPKMINFFLVDNLEYETDLLIWKKLSNQAVKENLSILRNILANIKEEVWKKEMLEYDIQNYIKTNEKNIGDFLWPMRVALTGSKASPGPFEVADVLGKEVSLLRIDEAIKKL